MILRGMNLVEGSAEEPDLDESFFALGIDAPLCLTGSKPFALPGASAEFSRGFGNPCGRLFNAVVRLLC